MIKTLSSIIKWFIFIACITLYILAIYINKEFDIMPFEQLIFSLFNSEGTSMFAIKDGIIFVGGWLLVVLCLIFVIRFFILKLKNRATFKVSIIKLNFKIDGIRVIINFVGILVSAYCLYSIAVNYGYLDYLNAQSKNSTLFEKYYVEPNKVNINFPKKKKNLIYIIMESMESTNFSEKNGGVRKESYIPNLEKLAENNINFSDKDGLGGLVEAELTSWTAASLVAQSGGIPLKVSVDGSIFCLAESCFPGVVGIGDILQQNGYKNYFMLGSDALFGGRREFYKRHGNYEIYDYKYAKKKKWIPKKYKKWWGFEDSKLYDFAKNELTRISQNEEPFNFTILTADTHFVDGYIDDQCSNKKFLNHYANSYYCSDKMTGNFINWIKEQDFYKDTVIVVLGDHKTMQSDFYDDNTENRAIYNTIINSDIVPVNTRNRLANVMDMYPTTLAALGATIENDRLGLGTNLFSAKPTYMEELGVDYFNSEIKKKSRYYNDRLISKSYYELENILNELE